jgi:hypothetical protein
MLGVRIGIVESFMRLLIASACLLWTALAASTTSAQSTTPPPATTPSATPEIKYKSPDDAIMKFGHVLGHVIADTDEKETTVKAAADAQTKVIQTQLAENNNGVNPEAATGKEVQKEMDDIDNGADPEAAAYMRDVQPVQSECPQGRVMSPAAAAACEARIAEVNQQFAALKARHDNLQSRKNQIDMDLANKNRDTANKNAELQAQENRIAIDTANKIAELDKRKAEATADLEKINACAGDPTTMSKKACLDHLFDNTSFQSSAYDLDPSVVKPDYLGGHKSSATIVKSQNKIHDDQQIRDIMKKKTTVPSPPSGSTAAK